MGWSGIQTLKLKEKRNTKTDNVLGPESDAVLNAFSVTSPAAIK